MGQAVTRNANFMPATVSAYYIIKKDPGVGPFKLLAALEVKILKSKFKKLLAGSTVPPRVFLIFTF
jgi:hypothetical protein